MRTLPMIALALMLLCTVACSKKDDVTVSLEIPAWLQLQVTQDENSIAADEKRMENYGAWIRYEFKGSYYYEYDNPLSSLSRNPYSQEGIQIDVATTPYATYWQERCCKQYAWKAPRYTSLE